MKRLYTLFIALLIASSAMTQTDDPCESCLPEGITFETQAQIDSFQIIYPNCSEIEGDVTICDLPWMNITNLSGLSMLTSLGGDLYIHDNNALNSLAGLESVTTIYGSLIFGDITESGQGDYSPTCLTGLEGLTSIGGDLWISLHYVLNSLTGLDNLTSIGGDLRIGHIPNLTSLSGLNNLNSIGGDIHIVGNGSLSNCAVQILCDYLANPNGAVDIIYNAEGCNNPLEVADSCGITLSCLPFGNYNFVAQADIDNFQSNFPGCSELEGDVFICGSDITNLDGLNVVTSIGGSLIINDNDDLTSLSGLDNVTSIGGDLRLYSNDALTSLSGLDNVTSIGGDLWLYSNDALTSLTGLDSVTSIGGYLWLLGNDILTNLTGLEGLTSIGGDLRLSSNDALTILTGLNNVVSIEGGISIEENNALTDLIGLANVTSIGGFLSIDGNLALTSLSGLDNIEAESISDLKIYDNTSLTTCEVQSICDYLVSPGGMVNIYNNASGCNNPTEVANACGYTLSCLPYGNYIFTSQADIDNFQSNYPDCVQLEGYVIIFGNDITNLSGLGVVTSIEGGLALGYNWVGNPVLTSLTGLENLTSTGGLYISSNDALTSLEGLDNIEADSITDLYIYNNNSLSNCDVQSICDYLVSPNGYIGISNNAEGCNNPEEVQDSCIANAIDINEHLMPDRINIYPNPTQTTINIELPTQPSKNTSLTISNTNGQQIISQAITEPQTKIDLTHFPAGIYIVKIWNDKEVMVRKVIKQ